MRNLIVKALVCGAAAGLAGCGGSTKTVTAPAPSSTHTVTQVIKTVTQSAPAPAPKKVKRHHHKAAPAPAPVTTAAAPAPAAPAGKTVPADLDGHALPAVESELDGDAIGYKTVGGGAFGIILKGDWGVCDTKPAGGQPVSGPVKLIVGHFTCGA